MAKQSQIDKAIEQLESEIAVLQLAVTKLRQQQIRAYVARQAAMLYVSADDAELAVTKLRQQQAKAPKRKTRAVVTAGPERAA